jgi:hypothetical protein
MDSERGSPTCPSLLLRRNHSMADKKISQLPVADTLTSADVLPLVQGTTTAKVSLTQLDSRWISTSSGGSITGGLTVSQYIAVGTNPATTGVLRLPNNQPMYVRDSANVANLYLLGLNSSDSVQLGNNASPNLGQSAKDGIQFTVGSVQQMSITPNFLIFKDSFFIAGGSTSGLKIGTAATQKLGFYGATPVVRPTGTPAAASDPATTMALVNSLRASLIALGLIS